MRIRKKKMLYEVVNLKTGEKKLILLPENLKIGRIYGIGTAKFWTYEDYIKVTSVENGAIYGESHFGSMQYLLKRV